MKLSITKGATSVLLRIFIQDSSKTNGAGLTGLTSGSAGLICYRARDDDGNAGGTQISLSAGTRGTWSSGGFVEKDSTNMPGVYEFGIPNAALASGSRSVLVMFSGATNMAPLPLEIELTGWDNQDSVHGGLTCLPNTAVTTNASLVTSGTGTDQISVTSGKVDAGKINGVSTSSVTTVNANVGTAQPTNFTGTGGSALVKSDAIDINSVSASSVTTINANIGTTQPTNFVGTGASALVKTDVEDFGGVAGTFTSGRPDVQTVQGSVVGSVASVTGAVGSVTGAVGSVTAGVTLAAVTHTGAIIPTVTTVTDLTSTNNAEPSALPASNASLASKIAWLFLLARNKLTQTASTQTAYAADSSTVVSTSTVSDDGTTATRGSFS